MRGKLFFEYSAMNAGKSTKLLQTNWSYNDNDKNVLLLKTSLDTRTKNTISSRLGIEQECELIDPEDNIRTKFFDKIKKDNIEVILVDEAQFLTRKQVLELRSMTIELNLIVTCYGLRTSFDGEVFEGSAVLLAVADKLIENITYCKICSKKATMNLKLDNNGEVVLEDENIIDPGFENKYLSVCYKHWYLASNKKISINELKKKERSRKRRKGDI